MNPDLHTSLAVHLHPQAWSLSLATICVLVALVYVRGWLRLQHGRPNTIRAWRVVAFMSGLFCVWIVVGSPLSAFDHESLTIHMINHLVLMMVAPPLLLAGTQGVSWLQGLPNQFHPFVQDVSSRSANFHRLLKHPVFGWLCATVTVIGWHVPAAFQLAAHSHVWHQVEYVSFVVAGLLFWRPVISASALAKPRWSTPMYLFLATLPCDVLSAFLVFCGRVVYPSYLSAPRLFALSPLEDQQCAGALMWVAVSFAYLVPAVVITMQLLSPATESSQPALDVVHTATPPPAHPSMHGSQADVA